MSIIRLTTITAVIVMMLFTGVASAAPAPPAAGTVKDAPASVTAYCKDHPNESSFTVVDSVNAVAYDCQAIRDHNKIRNTIIIYACLAILFVITIGIIATISG